MVSEQELGIGEAVLNLMREEEADVADVKTHGCAIISFPSFLPSLHAIIPQITTALLRSYKLNEQGRRRRIKTPIWIKLTHWAGLGYCLGYGP